MRTHSVLPLSPAAALNAHERSELAHVERQLGLFVRDLSLAPGNGMYARQLATCSAQLTAHFGKAGAAVPRRRACLYRRAREYTAHAGYVLLHLRDAQVIEDTPYTDGRALVARLDALLLGALAACAQECPQPSGDEDVPLEAPPTVPAPAVAAEAPRTAAFVDEAAHVPEARAAYTPTREAGANGRGEAPGMKASARGDAGGG